MKYINYITNDLLNGEGIRNTLWLSNCSHGCKGCFNKESWRDVGTEVDEEFLDKVLRDLNKPHCQGITLTGGCPMHRKNVDGVVNLCKRIKNELPDKDIWMYTGYLIEELRSDVWRSIILDYVDVVVEGKFIEELKVSGEWFGSKNQRVVKL